MVFFVRIPNKTTGRNAVDLTWSVPFQLSASPGTSQIHQLLNRKTVAMSRLLQVEVSLKGNSELLFFSVTLPGTEVTKRFQKKYMEKWNNRILSICLLYFYFSLKTSAVLITQSFCCNCMLLSLISSEFLNIYTHTYICISILTFFLH